MRARCAFVEEGEEEHDASYAAQGAAARGEEGSESQWQRLKRKWQQGKGKGVHKRLRGADQKLAGKRKGAQGTGVGDHKKQRKGTQGRRRTRQDGELWEVRDPEDSNSREKRPRTERDEIIERQGGRSTDH